jgi:hypothetical protein
VLVATATLGFAATKNEAGVVDGRNRAKTRLGLLLYREATVQAARGAPIYVVSDEQNAMLTLELICRDSQSGIVHTLRGLIAPAVCKGNVSDYWVSLLDTRHRPVHRATLFDYPKWAESTRAFLARCLDVVLQSSGTTGWFPTDECELTVREWGTQRLVDHISFRDVRRLPQIIQPAVLLGRSGWQIVRWICAQEAFGKQELPEPPVPVRPMIYDSSGVKYCRTSELPIEARVTFEGLQAYLDRPFVPAVADAVYPWWLDIFLRDELPRHELPREQRLSWS